MRKVDSRHLQSGRLSPPPPESGILVPMKFFDRSASVRPDAGVLVPIVVLFASSLNGASAKEAFHASFALLFASAAGLVLWAQAILLVLALYLYFAPVLLLHMGCQNACEPPGWKVDLSLKRLNRLYAFSIFSSIAIFVAGKMILLIMAGYPVYEKATDETFSRSVLQIFEAAINGLFVGVIMALQFENRLYKARETILRLHPRERVGYSSLFFKVFLILAAIVLYMTMQAFTAAGSFFSLGVQKFDPSATLPHQFLTGPDLIFQSRRLALLRDAMDIVFLRLAVMGFFTLQMLFELKMLIKRPLATVLDRLEALNSPKPTAFRTIDIVQNDEFACVFKEINSLIERQRGKLESSEARLASLVETAADPIVAFDSEGGIRLFNPAAETAFGYSRDEAIGSALGILLDVRPETFREAHTDGYARFEWKTRSDGRLLMESHISRTGNEAETWTTVVLRDVTKRAEIEENLKKAKLAAENASRMKSEFLANMSHELRTPLNAILGFTQLFGNDRNLTETQQDRIRIISRSGEHLLSLINDILDISKIEAGKMEVHETVFDLPEFVGDLQDMFELKCRKKGLKLYIETLDDLPRWVRGDLGKLRQVMVNLIGNAVKFTDEGGVGILVGREGSNIRFSIRDTGRGIPKDELEAILKPFVQATTSDHEGGTGLGLAISDSYVAMMGGHLSVESEPGEGSVFSFTVSLAPSAEAPERGDDAGFSILAAPGRAANVLVVDDQEANRLVLKEMLERVGFTVTEAADGKEAVERARGLMPGIIFMDIKMPVMDGYAATAALKSDPGTAGIRVFALTASAFSHDEKRIAEAGFDGFLAKPFKQGSLYRLIKDKGGVPLAEAAAPASEPVPDPNAPVAVDFRQASAALGSGGMTALEAAALINDFASLASSADRLSASAPSFATALKAAAGSYDEAAIAELLRAVAEAAVGPAAAADADAAAAEAGKDKTE
ncbi:MAG: hypothetical protein A2413_01100 [Treponema sp. RIFOXYC1_FULL_61_9]|nr:MAG: hypothetical protein A2413_01100 [Treponema sp. RIFOXYC1_FULL_61_9]